MHVPSSQLHLAIEIESDPISGAVSVGDGEARPFRGWIELVATIEGARTRCEPNLTLGWMPGAELPDAGYLAKRMIPGHGGNEAPDRSEGA